jgi:hypothetical protein
VEQSASLAAGFLNLRLPFFKPLCHARARASAGIKILLHKVGAKMNLQRSPSLCLCAVFSLGKVWPEKLWPPGRLTRESSLRLRSRN